jgi:benzoyl-CoA reductase/2-hydroxyglutaryl-CoA dehydratase subunit BcrC/BadD/HgdB
MQNSQKDKDIQPSELPQKEAFETKQVYQHKQPADTGKPLEKETGNAIPDEQLKENEKTSKEEGLNEEKLND